MPSSDKKTFKVMAECQKLKKIAVPVAAASLQRSEKKGKLSAKMATSPNRGATPHNEMQNTHMSMQKAQEHGLNRGTQKQILWIADFLFIISCPQSASDELLARKRRREHTFFATKIWRCAPRARAKHAK